VLPDVSTAALEPCPRTRAARKKKCIQTPPGVFANMGAWEHTERR
jgi:hypothetical protein